MAKKATGKGGGKGDNKSGSKPVARAKAPVASRSGKRNEFDTSEAFVKLLQSPLVAELVAVAATAALAALAEHGVSSRSSAGTRCKRAGKAVKEAGKAAAAAVGRRLGTEFDEIKKASKAGAKA